MKTMGGASVIGTARTKSGGERVRRGTTPAVVTNAAAATATRSDYRSALGLKGTWPDKRQHAALKSREENGEA